LSLAECKRLTDAAIAALWEAAPRLEDLCLYGCHLLTPDCLRGFNEEVALKRLNISGCYKLGDGFLRALFYLKPHVQLYNNPNENAGMTK